MTSEGRIKKSHNQPGEKVAETDSSKRDKGKDVAHKEHHAKRSKST